MISAGIDAGAGTTKAVVLLDGQVAGTSLLATGWDISRSAQEALEGALREAGIAREAVTRIIATGVGGKNVAFADDYFSDVTCDARGALQLIPTARTVLDIGAESSRGLKFDGSGKVLDFARNEKCAAGVGSFIESMARALETPVEEMGPLAEQSDAEIKMNVTCVIFAESEVVSLIHLKTPKAAIARAIHDSIASRAVAMLQRVGVQNEMVIVGGVVQNVGILSALKRRLGVDLAVPERPQLVAALGAALLAGQQPLS